MRLGAAMLIGAATLLSACAEQSTGYPQAGAAPYQSYPGYPYQSGDYAYDPGFYSRATTART